MYPTFDYEQLGPRDKWVSDQALWMAEFYDLLGEIWDDVEHLDRWQLPRLREMICNHFKIQVNLDRPLEHPFRMK